MLSEKGFGKDLTQKGKFYLYLNSICPIIDIIHMLWKMYVEDRDKGILDYHKNISPFRPHPCGNDSLFHTIGGSIDPDMFLDYYQPRENHLICIQMIGHPYFICKFERTKERLEESVHYFDALINEPQTKLTKLQKKDVLEKAIQNLTDNKYNLTKEPMMRYLLSLYNMYMNMKVLHSYPIAIDCKGDLCRFE